MRISPRLRPGARPSCPKRPLLAVQANTGIVYTCDATITAVAGVCGYLNSTIANLYSSTFSNANVSIYIQFGQTGLGESLTSIQTASYASFQAALVASASSANDFAAIAGSVPQTNPFGTDSVQTTNANLRALGFGVAFGLTTSGNSCNLGNANCYDGVITISNSFLASGDLYFRTGTIAWNQYDFYSVVEHETDEVLGTSSCAIAGCGFGRNVSFAPADFFRYSSSGVRTMTAGTNDSCSSSDTTNACFSLDGATMLLQYNNLDNSEDPGDWAPNCSAPRVQNSEACPGTDPDISPTEILVLDVVGFNVGPMAATLTSPANRATGQPLSANLVWGASTNATSYDVYFGTSNPPPMVTNTTSTTFTPSTLAVGTQYFWEIVARNSLGTTASAIWSFTTQQPGAPTLVSPSNGATGQPLSTSVSWSGSQPIPTTFTFGTSSTPPLVTNTTSTLYTPSTLSAGVQYYWQIVAKTSTGSSASAIWSFTTLPAPRAPPVVSSPSNGATGQALSTGIVWNAASGATSYDVYFGTSSAPPFVTNTTSTAYTPATLTAGIQYFWQIVAKNSSGGTASAIWSFTTVPSGAHPVSVSPSPGTAGRQVFTFTAQDVNGAGSIKYAQFLFSKPGLTALNACYVSYDPVANVFYLLSDNKTQWYGLVAGSASTTGNAQCLIHGATSGSSKASNNLITTLDLSFRTPFAGTKTNLEFAGDTSGQTSGWASVGSWNDSGDPNVVTITSLGPLPGSGATQTLTATIIETPATNVSFAQIH